MSASDILLAPDGPEAFKFTFTTENGRIMGRVAVDTAQRPDNRTDEEKAAAAKKRVKALAGEFLKAASKD